MESKHKDYTPIFCECGKHLYDEDHRSINPNDINAVERLAKNGQWLGAFVVKQYQEKNTTKVMKGDS